MLCDICMVPGTLDTVKFNILKNVKIYKEHIRNQHAKCIQLSTNMPSTGLVILEIGNVIQNSKKKSGLGMLKSIAFRVLKVYSVISFHRAPSIGDFCHENEEFFNTFALTMMEAF